MGQKTKEERMEIQLVDETVGRYAQKMRDAELVGYDMPSIWTS